MIKTQKASRREFGKMTLSTGLMIGVPACAQTQKIRPIPLSNDPALNAPLKDLAAKKGLRFGTAIGSNRNGGLQDPAYLEIIKRECNLLVAENEHKLYTIMRTPDHYEFGPADALVDFASAHDIPFRGHTLLWDNEDFIPDWVESYDFGRDERKGMRAFLREYFRTVCTHFGDRIKSWDVVNEAISPYSGRERNTVFRRLADDELIEYCFQLAREYAPHAELVYNDFPTWERWRGIHRDGVLRLLERLKARNVPIDAVGIQSHLGLMTGNPTSGFPDPQQKAWRDFMDEIVAMGFNILITEFDVNDAKLTADIERRDQIIADYGGAYLDLMLDYPQVKDIVAWGLADRYSWLQNWWPRKDGVRKRPTLYDENLRPKPLRQAVARSLLNAPVRDS